MYVFVRVGPLLAAVERLLLCVRVHNERDARLLPQLLEPPLHQVHVSSHLLGHRRQQGASPPILPALFTSSYGCLIPGNLFPFKYFQVGNKFQLLKCIKKPILKNFK